MPISKKKRFTILGIDPGFAITGYGLITCQSGNISVHSCGAITTSSQEPYSQRLGTLYADLITIINKHKPDCIAVEELFFAKNVKTALKVGQARGVVLLAGWKKNIPLREFTPLQVKQALVGYGRASKSQVQTMVAAQLKLNNIPQPDDVADALAVAICCCQTKEFLLPS